ncbi:ArsR family transcriptional regulator [Roseiarcus fermentans]|uniref:ArsR family transcriptional regulator n=2 Tax=Roseiarcus fermentans TaxID=1473586 RepID=A0A366FE30_9HYPH|nr:ArsR family transcriptional regulator [Roseiarcus fermentans]
MIQDRKQRVRRVAERGETSESAGAPDVFGALASPVRRRLLMALRAGPRTVSDLCEGLPVARPAVSEHLALLRDVGLVRVQKRGRERVYHLDPRPLTEVGAWLNVMLAFWNMRLGDLDRIGEE